MMITRVIITIIGIIYVKCLANHRLSVTYGSSGGADGDNGVGIGDDDGEKDGGGADLKNASEL